MTFTLINIGRGFQDFVKKKKIGLKLMPLEDTEK